VLFLANLDVHRMQDNHVLDLILCIDESVLSFCVCKFLLGQCPSPEQPFWSPINNNVNSNVTCQQASLPQRPPEQIANAANNVVIRNSVGAPIVPFIPMQCQLPFCCNCFAQTQMGPCCEKRAKWLMTQKGRPPHHPLCSNRQHMKNNRLHVSAPLFLPLS